MSFFARRDIARECCFQRIFEPSEDLYRDKYNIFFMTLHVIYCAFIKRKLVSELEEFTSV